jgi:hypothetical protein
MQSRATIPRSRAPYFVIVLHSTHHHPDVTMLTRVVPWVLGAVAPFLSLNEARAAAPVALAYDAVPGCPSETDFKAAVEARDGNFTGERAPGSAWALRISIVRDDAGFRGTLQSTTEDTTSALREVHGESCQEVVDALAVVSATALSPRAETTAAVSEPAPVTPASAPASARASPPPPARDADRHLRVVGGFGFAPSHRKMRVEAGTLHFDKVSNLLISGGAQLGLVPHTLVPRYDLAFSTTNFITTPSGASFLGGASPRMHFSFLGPSTYRTHDASSRVLGVLFGLGICRSFIYDTRGWAVHYCGELGGGALYVDSKDAQGTRLGDKTTGVGFAGYGIDTQYHLGPVFELGLKIGMDVFTNKLSAERPDGSKIFESSSFTGYGMLSLGAQF